MSKLKVIFAQVGLVLVLMIAIEAIFWYILSKQSKQQPFFLNPVVYKKNATKKRVNLSFDQVDPLLGWSESEEALKVKGLYVSDGCIIMSTSMADSNAIKLMITGGSTTDIHVIAENWPVDFLKLCEQNNLNVKILLAAVGGYSSGQEVLKVLRDGLKLKPDIHITYSGANEAHWPGYISEYEEKLFRQAFHIASTSLLLPNTMHFIRSGWLKDSEVKLYEAPKPNAADFWNQNIQVMRSLSLGYNHQFLAFLQPVRGVGSYQQPEGESEYAQFMDGYKQFYPKAIQYSVQHNYVVNLTGIFDTCTGPVYTDDCHLNKEYQHIPARAIFSELQSRGWLVRP